MSWSHWKYFLQSAHATEIKKKIKNLDLCPEYHQALVIKLYNFSKLKRDIVWSVTTNTEWKYFLSQIKFKKIKYQSFPIKTICIQCSGRLSNKYAWILYF